MSTRRNYRMGDGRMDIETVVSREAVNALADEFWGEVKLGEPDECWLWQGDVAAEYGYFYVSRDLLIPGLCGPHRAHRVSYFLANRVWPGKSFVCHSCDTPPCVNPSHLWLGSHLDNMRDMVEKGRHGQQRHNTSPRIRERDEQMLAAHAAGESVADIGRAWDLSRQAVYEILRRQGAQFRKYPKRRRRDNLHDEW